MIKLRSLPKSTITRVLAAAFLLVALFLGKRTYDLSSAPNREADCDFTYPDNAGAADLDVSSPALDEAPFELAQEGGSINDASCLNKTGVYGVAAITTENDIREALTFARARDLKITPAGSRHSMGGHSFSKGGLVLDMRGFNQLTVDVEAKVLNVQSGATWREVQAVLDTLGLAVKAMQSINLFTVGGTLSVNAHGIAHEPGQIAPTVRAMRVMLSSGEIMVTSPTENRDLFRAVLGGYGLAGVILDVDLDIVDNEVYAWSTDYIDYQDFGDFYEREIVDREEVALAYARLSIAPNSYLRETAVHRYQYIDFEAAPQRIRPAERVWIKRLLFNLSKTGGLGRWIRWTAEKRIEPGVHDCIRRENVRSGTREEVCLASRNRKMNQSMEYLDSKQEDTNILQEYFLPLDNTTAFIDGLRDIVTETDVNLLNVTLRIVTKDSITALPYAKDQRIAFVLYFNQRLNEDDSRKLEQATVALIDLAIDNGGTFYLPYQLHYSPEQLRAAYPEVDEFFALKRQFDPIDLFSNAFYEKYGR